MLFLSTTRDEKYKARQAIDTYFWRDGDVLAAMTVFAGTVLMTLSIRQFAILSVVLAAAWLIIAFMIAREHWWLVPDDVVTKAIGKPG